MSLNQQETEAAKALIQLALAEDLGQLGDLTSNATIPTETVGRAHLVARADGVIAGLPVVALVCCAMEQRLKINAAVADGSNVKRGEVLATITGQMRGILAAERTALNFLQRLSGIATLTRRYVDATKGYSQVFDTRKTTPGWRSLEKYAVRCGRGHNHRIGLYDAILIKDNHIAALGGGPSGVTAAIAAARKHTPGIPIEVEVESFDMLEAALAAKPEIVLLDNMSAVELQRCVARRNEVDSKIQLEASGGINLDTIAAIAATGVDRISVGAITHSAPALDIALDYQS